MSHIVIAEVTALPGAADRLRAAIEHLAQAVRLEAGNERFEVFSKSGTAPGWLILERYHDPASFERHLTMAHTLAFNKALSDLAEGGASSVTDLTAAMIDGASEPDMRGLDHIGVTVPDIDAASSFLTHAFGARALYDVQPADAAPMAGEETERQLGLPAGACIVHMRFMRIGRSAGIELFQIERAEQAKAAGIVDIGLQHLAINTDDMAAACARFSAAGGRLLSDPHPLARVEDGPNNRGVYGKTPWGMLIEFIHLPDGVDYSSGCASARWAPLSNS